MAENQLRLLKFAIQYSGWHTYGKDVARSIYSLAKLGLLEVSRETRQFRLLTHNRSY